MIKINRILSLSEKGPRASQEDFIVVDRQSPARLMVLCDGMGGHGHGEVASRTAAQSVFDRLKKIGNRDYTTDDFQDAVDFGMSRLAEADTFSDDKPMGTTLVIAAVNRESLLIGHIGDSRCYIFDKNGNIVFKTKDHSKVREAVDAEILTEEEARTSPYRNIVTRCMIAGGRSVAVDTSAVDIEGDVSMIICSDGVSDAINDQELRAMTIDRDPEGIVASIEAQCRLAAADNYSAIVASMSNDALPRDDIKADNRPIDRHEAATCRPVGPRPENRCHFCGREIRPEATFCPSCGNRVTAGVKDKKPLKTIILAVAAGVIIGVIAMLCLSSGEKEDRQSSPSDPKKAVTTEINNMSGAPDNPKAGDSDNNR